MRLHRYRLPGIQGIKFYEIKLGQGYSVYSDLLHKANEQGEGNDTTHEQYPKAADDCCNDIYHISAVTTFHTDNGKYQPCENRQDVKSSPYGTHPVCQCNVE